MTRSEAGKLGAKASAAVKRARRIARCNAARQDVIRRAKARRWGYKWPQP